MHEKDNLFKKKLREIHFQGNKSIKVNNEQRCIENINNQINQESVIIEPWVKTPFFLAFT